MDFIPGLLQGITRVGISYPFDTVKVHMQKNRTNFFDTLRSIKTRDAKIFYRGALTAFMVTPMDRSIQYYLAEKYNNKYNPFLISSTLSLISLIYNVPLQYICTNIVLHKQKINTINFLKIINYSKVYNGISVECMRMFIGSSTYLGTYFYLRNEYNKTNNLFISSCFGVLSNLISWSIIFPLDTIRTMKQTSNNNYLKIISNYKYRDFKFLYNGIVSVYLRTFPSAFMGMFVYEYSKRLIN